MFWNITISTLSRLILVDKNIISETAEPGILRAEQRKNMFDAETSAGAQGRAMPWPRQRSATNWTPAGRPSSCRCCQRALAPPRLKLRSTIRRQLQWSAPEWGVNNRT